MKIVKKLLSVFLACCLLVGGLPLSAFAEEDPPPASGSCGDQVTWSLDSDGVFTVSGTGDMTDYSSSSIPWKSVIASITSVVVEAGVTRVGANSFYQATSLSGVSLPDGLLSIGERAFFGCSGLTSVTVPEGVTSLGSGVFQNTGLTSISLPDSITEIGSYALSGCSSLTSVKLPKDLTVIEENMFMNDGKLSSITMPTAVTTIKKSAFTTCGGFTSFTIPSSVTTIESNAFSSCSGLTSITIPKNVTTIEGNPFQTCDKMSSILVSSENPSFASYGGVLFSKDMETLLVFPYNKSSFTIPEGTLHIGDNSFRMCSKLTSLTFPSTLKTIGNYVFDSCRLSQITLPEGLESIGKYAFERNTSLKNFTIPESVTFIDEHAFQSCTSLTNMVVPNSVNVGKEFGAFWGCSKLESVTLPNAINALDTYAFDGCTSLKSITIPESVRTIDTAAFQNCSSLTEIVIPEGVTKIETAAFYGCSSLASITLPESIKQIGSARSSDTYNPFGSCSRLNDVYYNSSRKMWAKIIGTGINSSKKLTSRPSAVIHFAKADITYDANGGAGTMVDGLQWKDADLTLPECGFTAPEGKVFKAWAVDATEYAPGDAYTVTDDVNVIAMWKEEPAPTYVTVSRVSGTGAIAIPPRAQGSAATVQVPLQAVLYDQYDTSVEDEFYWSIQSAATGVLITSSGVLSVTSEAEAGKITVQAVSKTYGLSGTLELTLQKNSSYLDRVEVAPLAYNTVKVPASNMGSETTQLTVLLYDQYGQQLPANDAEITWTLNDKEPASNTVTLSQDGKLTVPSTASAGSVTVSAQATLDGVTVTSESVVISVVRDPARPTRIRIIRADSDPDDCTVQIPGAGSATAAFATQCYDQYGDLFEDTITWSIQSAAAGVSISSSGVLSVTSEVEAGTITIRALTATVGIGATLEVTLEKEPSYLDSVEVVPPSNNAIAVPYPNAGPKTVQLTVLLYDQYGQQLPANDAEITWSLNGKEPASNTVTLSQDGKLTVPSTASAGSVTVSAQATLDGVTVTSEPAVISVVKEAARLTRITIIRADSDPDDFTVQAPGAGSTTASFALLCYDQYGLEMTLPAEARTVWELDGGLLPGVTISQDGVITVTEEAANGCSAHIRATVVQTSSSAIVSDALAVVIEPAPLVTLTFDANGGTGSMELIAVPQGASVTLPACGFTAPQGKEFEGWRIGGAQYAPGDAYTALDHVSVSPVWGDVSVPAAPVSRKLSTGVSHTMALKEDGSLWAWGDNAFGQLGNGTTEAKTTPQKILEHVASVQTSSYSSFAVKEDGSLWAWGSNANGLLGDGTTVDRHAPVKILEGVADVSCVEQSVFVLKRDGTLWAWGDNSSGQLGDGATTDRRTPVKIMKSVKAVSAGWTHTLVLKSDNSVWAWGYNAEGQVGDGTTVNRSSPVKVMENASAVAIGAMHSLALDADGNVWAWGSNDSGAFGNGTTTGSLTPVKIQEDILAIGAAKYSSFFIKANRSLWACGTNANGMLGDGTTTDRLTPVKVLENVSSFSSRIAHSAALRTDGCLWAWGYNAEGQVGDGTLNMKLSPVKIWGGHFTAGFVADGVTVAEEEFCLCAPTVTEPAVPAKAHYDGVWESYDLSSASGDITIQAVYTLNNDHLYSTETVTAATCLAGGYTAHTCSCGAFYVDNETPALDHDFQKVPEKCVAPTRGKDGYDYFECTRDPSHIVTIPVYLPIVTHTATFLVGDEVIGRVVFEEGAASLEEPPLPERKNYVGRWESYDLAAATDDITVHGLYTPVDPDQVSDVTPETETEYENGVVTVTLSAVAASKTIKVVSEVTTPVDVVLVLDQSGSMAETLSTKGKLSKRNALINCAKEFVQSLYDNAVQTGADHRVAVVGFACSEYNKKGINKAGYLNTCLLTTSSGKPVNYAKLNKRYYAEALLPINSDGKINANVISGIESIKAEGATAAHLGFEMAKGIFSENTAQTTRERVVIFITDGVPTRWLVEEDDILPTASDAIQKAHLLKTSQNAKIYSIGVDAGANASAKFTDSKNGVTTNWGSVTYDFNRFLHLVSSNYPNALSMSNYGADGDKNGGYYMAVNDTENLSSIFTNILYSTVYQLKAFEKVTFHYTLPSQFTLTMEQEAQLREDLKNTLGINKSDVLVQREQDGTTKLTFQNVPTREVYDDSGALVYKASLSFSVSANQTASGSTSGGSGSVEYDGSGIGEFTASVVDVPADRHLLVFTIDGQVYRITEAQLGDVVEVPYSTLASWKIPAGTVVSGDYAVFEAHEVADETYTLRWILGDTTETQTYHYGEKIVPPDPTAAAPEGQEFSCWSRSIPDIMPACDLECAAIYSPIHVHSFEAFAKKGNCDTGVITVFRCACGEERQEQAAPAAHNYAAIFSDNGSSAAATTKLVCTKCGDSQEQDLTYKVAETEDKSATVLDLNMYQNESSVTVPEEDVEIRYYMGEENDGKPYSVTRVDEDSTKTSYDNVVQNGYLTFFANHFSIYIIGEQSGDSALAGDLAYEEALEVLDSKTDATTDKEPEASKPTGPSDPAVPGDPGAGGEEEPALPASERFTDVSEKNWFHDAVGFVVDKGLFYGTSETTFAPYGTMTRAMLMTVLARLDGQDTDGGETWYSKGMAWAVEQGISDGTSPQAPITREQLAAMLYRYAGSPQTSGSLDGFYDKNKADGWAVSALQWAVEVGVITGKGNGRLDPLGRATRAEVATMIARYCNAVK